MQFCARECKMTSRSIVKDKCERFLVDAFIRWWASETGEQFQVISRPDPPDAIIQSDLRTSWIEVTDAFYSDEWAKDRYSDATPGETHKPMKSGPYVGMDAQAAGRFVTLLKKKLSKKSYENPHKKYGSGMLLVAVKSPWFDRDEMRDACYKTDWSLDHGFFSSVFISFRSLNQQTFEEWKWDAQQDKREMGERP